MLFQIFPLGQALAFAGCEVLIFTKGDTLGGGISDPELVTLAKKEFAKDMEVIEDTVTGINVIEDKVQLEHSGVMSQVDQVVIAVGRKPNIEGTEIYFVGDVNRDRPLLHEASDQGRIAGFNSVQKIDQKFQQKVPLGITFTSPQIASVGLNHQKLKQAKINYAEGVASFENQGRAVAQIENKGMLKVYGDPDSGLILGAEIFAPAGEHLAHLLAWGIAGKATVFDLLDRPFYHPVLEEGLRTALRNLSKKIKVPCAESQSVRCQDPPAGV